jgi:hypothetical protein
MNLKTRRIQLIVAVMAAAVAATASAAKVSFATKAPACGASDVSNLTGANTESDNVNGGDHDATYIADDRPLQGQTFTTGTNAAGYQLRSVTLREVSFDTYALIPDLTYTVRVTQPAEGKFLRLASETATLASDAPGNLPNLGDGGDMGMGSGKFITFTLDKVVELKPNTTYGFDVSGGTDRHYWQWDGTDKDVYRGGSAYSVSPRGKVTERSGDHVFVVGMSLRQVAEAGKASANATEPGPATYLVNTPTTPKSK